jgi:8-oxo-dGTP pyrophosphatase MutT (NUDIX family)
LYSFYTEPVYHKLEARMGKVFCLRNQPENGKMNEQQAKVLDLLANSILTTELDDLQVYQFAAFVRENPACCERSLLIGHLTGSAWLVSNDGQRALLMHHRKLNRWLQPGGHADGNADLAQVALREAIEETGLSDLQAEPEIYDLDLHRIPARGEEPEHWHYDVRFVVRACGSELYIQNEESLALAWFDIQKLANDAELDESIRRMANKWLGRFDKLNDH